MSPEEKRFCDECEAVYRMDGRAKGCGHREWAKEASGWNEANDEGGPGGRVVMSTYECWAPSGCLHVAGREEEE